MKIIEPLEVIDFLNFMNKAMILTDSRVASEEAFFRKPVLVMRDTTERQGCGCRDSEIGRNRRRKPSIAASSFFWKIRRIQEDERTSNPLGMERLGNRL